MSSKPVWGQLRVGRRGLVSLSWWIELTIVASIRINPLRPCLMQARVSPDFLAVINFDQEFRDYGKVIATAPFAAPDATGNEPYHIGLSSDGKVVTCGGLLSVLKGQKEIFFFDVSNPMAPKFMSAADPPLAAGSRSSKDCFALPVLEPISLAST